jgi:hypothetical protein
MIKKLGGWGNFIGLCILLFFIIQGIIKWQTRIENASYVYGVSEGIRKGVRGHFRLYYKFKVDGVEYTGRVPEAFCKDCSNCCDVGDKVIVRYKNGNPKNNDLVISIPLSQQRLPK